MRASGRALLAFIAALVACSALAMASGWKHYGNARFQYWIDIPPDFSRFEESENGDGGVSSSLDGTAELSIWGGYLADSDFASEVEWRIAQDRSDGWSITYEKKRAKWAVWSGAKGNRIFYERAIPVCDDTAVYFRLAYDSKQVNAFDPIISRLVKSQRSGDC